MDVVLTEQAREVVRNVIAERGTDLTMVIGNGCCDSTAPFLFAGYVGGPNEREVARVEGVPVLLDDTLGELFDGREVVIDVRPDPGEDSFSCETELGVRLSMERMPALR